MQAIKISVYLMAFVLANFIVIWFGEVGLIFTALFLIPFDFVMRCLFHEQWKGIELFLKLGSLVGIASILTYVINNDAKNIALASTFGFISAQMLASVFYQTYIKKSFLFKVNGSDALGVIADSIVFQVIAFGSISTSITLSQVALKIVGGVFWYYLIFHKYKLHKKWIKSK
jgi:queuosine precursor transporter